MCEIDVKHAGETPNYSIQVTQGIVSNIIVSLCSRPPESGGILLGPIGKTEISDFVFDIGGSCTGTTYSPDHVALQRRLNKEWLPSGRDMKGFAHSHPGRLDRLSAGDLAYINRLLMSPGNADMDLFVAPIVIPEEFRLVPFVVHRGSSDRAVVAQLTIS